MGCSYLKGEPKGGITPRRQARMFYVLVLHRLRRPHLRLAAEPSGIAQIRAGTLDDTTWLTPVAHMFMRSAEPWIQPAANAECHEMQPSDF